MKRIAIFLLIALLPFLLGAGSKRGKGGGDAVPTFTVANLPTSAATGQLALVTDGNTDSDCQVGGSTFAVLCFWDGDSWEPTGDAGSGSGDSITVDGVAAVDPTFGDTSQITSSMAANAITWDIAANSLADGHIADDAISPAELDDEDVEDREATVGDTVHVSTSDIAFFTYLNAAEHISQVGAAGVGANTFTGTQQGTTWSVTDAGVGKFTSLDDVDGSPLWSIPTTGAITAVSYGGITEANLVDKADSEDVTGDWNFGGGSIEIGNGVAASAPGTPAVGMLYQVTDADSASVCTNGGAGATDSLCIYNGAAWVAVAGTGSGDLLADGSIPLSANWDVGNFTLTANGLTIDGALTGVASLAGATEATIEAQIYDSDVQSISGAWTFTNGIKSEDDKAFLWGTDNDWNSQYDESVDDQMLITTTNTTAIADGDPMLQILVDFGTASGTALDADQDVFGVGKGTQATAVDLFTVDAEGDVVVLGDTSLGGAYTFTTAGRIALGATLNDDVCDTAGEFWYDTTTNAFEFCQAASGAPVTLGGGSATWTDQGTIYTTATPGTDLLAIGANAQFESAHISVTAASDTPGLVLREHASATANPLVVETSADAHTFEVGPAGAVTAQSIQDIDGPGTNWEIDSAGDATFNSVTTGSSTTPTVGFDDSDDTGAVDGSIVVDCPTANDCDMSFGVDSGTDTEYVIMKFDTETGGATVVQIGQPGSNSTDISEAGVITFTGTGDIDLPANSVDTADITALNVTEDKLAASLAFDDGDVIDLSAVSVVGTGTGLILPGHATDCSATGTTEGQVCWEADANALYIGNGTTVTTFAAGGGDVTDVFDCATGNCSSIVAGATDLLNFAANDASTATEGLILPQIASACAGATANGQICYDTAGNDLYIGNGATVDQMNGAAPATEVRSMYWGAGAMEVDGTGCTAATAVALVTSGPTPLTIACADSDTATISGSTVMPDGWNAGTITFELTVGQILASTGAYRIDFEGQCIGSDEPFLAFAGTGEQAAAITLTADDDTVQATTSAVTLNGSTCAAGDVLVWQGAVNAGVSATNLETLAVVVGVKAEYTSTIGD